MGGGHPPDTLNKLDTLDSFDTLDTLDKLDKTDKLYTFDKRYTLDTQRRCTSVFVGGIFGYEHKYIFHLHIWMTGGHKVHVWILVHL